MLEERQLWRKKTLAFAVPAIGIETAQRGIDGVNIVGAFDGRLGDRAAAGRTGIEELAPRVRPAAQFGDAFGELMGMAPSRMGIGRLPPMSRSSFSQSFVVPS